MGDHRKDLNLEWTLFLLVALSTWHNAWLLHSANPFEFLRHGGDALGYYQWLPAVFIDQDVGRMYWTYEMDGGGHLSLFTIGVAVLQAPFFALGHMCALGFGYPANGFSSPYAVGQIMGAAFYAGAGIVLAFRLARRYSDTLSALLATVALFAATNLFYYSVYEPLMSHLYSFFLIGLFCYSGIRVLDQDHRPRHVLSFLLAGSLMILVRQLNVIVLLFPLWMAWRSPDGIGGLLRTLTAHRTALITGALLALVPWILQSWYWMHTVGEPFTFTYGKKGETFHFGKMVPGMVMVSVRNGWFVYTPLMLATSASLLFHAVKGRSPARPVLLILLLSWLLYSAWWAWWLGTGYGYRGFVDLYALLCIPLAWMFHRILLRPWPMRLVAALVLVALIKLNFGLMERFTWDWSWEAWTWPKFFEQVSAVITG